jgi:hypothetical protein
MDASATGYLWLPADTMVELTGEQILQAVLHHVAGAALTLQLLERYPRKPPVSLEAPRPQPARPLPRLLGVGRRRLLGYGHPNPLPPSGRG